MITGVPGSTLGAGTGGEGDHAANPHTDYLGKQLPQGSAMARAAPSGRRLPTRLESNHSGVIGRPTMLKDAERRSRYSLTHDATLHFHLRDDLGRA